VLYVQPIPLIASVWDATLLWLVSALPFFCDSALGMVSRFLARAYGGELPNTLQLVDLSEQTPVMNMTRATRSSLELTVAKKVG
jgi:hypothetical protein